MTEECVDGEQVDMVRLRARTREEKASASVTGMGGIVVNSGGGGEGGIRTHGTPCERTHAFQACSFNHSDTSPLEEQIVAVAVGASQFARLQEESKTG